MNKYDWMKPITIEGEDAIRFLEEFENVNKTLTKEKIDEIKQKVFAIEFRVIR